MQFRNGWHFVSSNDGKVAPEKLIQNISEKPQIFFSQKLFKNCIVIDNDFEMKK